MVVYYLNMYLGNFIFIGKGAELPGISNTNRQ